ncbi:PD-(D/E)XK nuclease family protein [uncultured Draconibacterium sp.]|uniref:PD-(D/E)XK nuclease family protein n=1 Tax=uncultured Draconibacterium sp. TaxID=1573823 RepID=UPI0032178C94
MERFLSQCANYIYQKHSNELNELCLVFPNRRSGAFFTQYMQDVIKRPVVGPKTTTVNELISSYSDLHKGEKLQLISILYDVFRKHTKTTETFDEFYFWGEILLADFNDIDRYLVNAKDVFTNISDLKEIESIFDYLTPEQKKALEQFWGSMAVVDKKGFQEKYTFIWDKLFPVYVDFKKELQKDDLAFPGMVDRTVVENLDSAELEFKYKKYYIIGLNALNTCEKKFFTHLVNLGKAEFLWDFDKSYLEDIQNEAGYFLRTNLVEFPPPDDFELNTEIFSQRKNIKLVAVSSVYGQSQQIPNFLTETRLDYKEKFDNTAVVLADESLLFSAMGAIPENIGTVNVTMGYSVRNSVIHGFLMLLVTLLKNKRKEGSGFVAYHRYVTDVLNHQLLGDSESEKSKAFVAELKRTNSITVDLSKIDFAPLYKQIFLLPEKVEEYSHYFLKVLGMLHQQFKASEVNNAMLLEIIYSIYQAVEKLGIVVKGVIDSQKREINEAVYFRLFSQYLGQVSVAFEGEPLSGLQVMGILETRCLDFENLIVLGLNENKWPRKFTAPSFIPFNIRKGFGLPGIDEQDAMYGYYFYRLIQRARNITATYSVVKEGIGTGELSRYGYQLQYDSIHKPEMKNLDFVFANDPVQSIEIKSSKDVVQKLLENNSEEHPLSPSAINTYLHCTLKFYFRYVVNLPEPDEVKEEIDGVVFGNIFHDTLEELYKPFVGKVVNKTDLENMLKDRVRLENEITKQIAIHYLKKKKPIKGPVKLQGKTLLIFENAITYLKQLLRVDLAIAPFSVISLEEKYKRWIELELNGAKTNLCIGGKIDRVDKVDGQLRVLDYKTGNVESLGFSKIEDLFDAEIKKPKKEILQALIYSWGLSENISNEAIQPAIYSLRSLFSESFSPNVKLNKNDVLFEDLKEDFEINLKQLVTEIYSERNTFKQTEHIEKCQYCPYSGICRRF